MDPGEEEEEEVHKRFRECVCMNCGYVTPHKRRISCYEMRCPDCGVRLIED